MAKKLFWKITSSTCIYVVEKRLFWAFCDFMYLVMYSLSVEWNTQINEDTFTNDVQDPTGVEKVKFRIPRIL